MPKKVYENNYPLSFIFRLKNMVTIIQGVRIGVVRGW